MCRQGRDRAALSSSLGAARGEQFSLGSSDAGPRQQISIMAGRWMLSAPNAPSCGLEFGGAPGRARAKSRRKAAVRADFFMSRRWALEGDAL